jgi:hypothetical protein
MIKVIGSVFTVHAMKAYGGNGVVVKPIPNFDIGWNFDLLTLRSLFPQGKRTTMLIV